MKALKVLLLLGGNYLVCLVLTFIIVGAGATWASQVKGADNAGMAGLALVAVILVLFLAATVIASLSLRSSVETAARVALTVSYGLLLLATAALAGFGLMIALNR